MIAAVLKSFNSPLEIENYSISPLEDDEVLIRLHSAAINHRDVWIQQNKYGKVTLPAILGSDGAGYIEAVGEDVDESWLEKEVLINPSNDWGAKESFQSTDFHILGMPTAGTFATHVKVKVDRVFDIPDHLSFEEAAALPLAGLTAYRALVVKCNPQKREKVLISGVGGGVATMALLFGVALGCEVWVTSGTDAKIEHAKSLGALGGFNYKEKGWGKLALAQTGGFSVIIDSAGGDNFSELLSAAAYGARVCIYGGTAGTMAVNPQMLFWKQLKIIGSTMGSDLDFESMLNFVSTRRIQPVIDEIYSLQGINLAMQKMAKGQQLGKIIVRCNDDE